MVDLLQVAKSAQAQQLLQLSSFVVAQRERSRNRVHPAFVSGLDASSGEVLALRTNGELVRTRSITNAALTIGQLVEVSRPRGAQVGFLDARVRG